WQSLSVTDLNPGTHAMTVFVNGVPSIAEIVDVIGAPTATTLMSGTNPSNPGQSVTLTATVSGNTPSGTIGFFDGASSISGCGTTLLSSGQAICATTLLPSGTDSITAVYS